MSDWVYVAAAFIIVGGALAAYAIVLARRVSEVRRTVRALRESQNHQNRQLEQDSTICDAPPAR